MKGKIYIVAQTSERELVWAFTQSETGAIDFEGKAQAQSWNDFQSIVSSTYFSPAAFFFLPNLERAHIRIYVEKNCDITEQNKFAFFAHIGPLLLAVEAKDSMLAAELLESKADLFEKFADLVRFIIEPIAIEIFFSYAFGSFAFQSDKRKDLHGHYHFGKMQFVWVIARKKLSFDAENDTLENAYIRYFKNSHTTLSLPIVGLQYGSWNWESKILFETSAHIEAKHIFDDAKEIAKARNDIFQSLEVAVQIEPYNSHDENALAVFIDNIDAKISGYPNKAKAGYIKKTATKIIRLAKPETMSFTSRLLRFNTDEVVVQIEV